MVLFREIWIVKFVFIYFLLMTDVLDAEETQLLFSNEVDIRSFVYGSNTYTHVLGGLNYVRSLDYDYKEQRLFFIDLQNLERTIIKTKLLNEDNSTKVIVDSTETGETDWKVLAVDWVTKKLYFTDVQSNRVEVTHYDGSCRKVLVSKGLDQPNGIALFPQKGLMFVTDWGHTKKIERFNMDGTDRKVLVEIADSWPESVTVDYETSIVYWSDKVHNTINAMTIDGKSQTKYLSSKTQPIYLTLSSSRLFWSDTQSIYSILKTGQDKNITTISSSGSLYTDPLDVKVFSKHRQPFVKTLCAIENGGCSHLCLLRAGGVTCACPTGIILMEDKKTCQNGMEKFVVFARRTSIRLVSLDVDTDVDFRLEVSELYTKNVYGVTYDIETRRVYWANSGCNSPGRDTGSAPLVCKNPGSINSVFLNGTGYVSVVTEDIKSPDHLVIDWIARNLYWTDANLARIEVFNLDTSSRKIIISDHLLQPRGIAIDPADGKIYWTDWGNTSKIESADLDGDKRKVLVHKNVRWPNGIAIDHQGRKLYWADPYYNSLFSYNLHSEEVEVFSDGANHPFGVAVLGDYVYWTDWYRKVSRIRIHAKEKAEVIFDGIPELMGISAVDTSIKYGSNPCHYKAYNCSHLCFHKPKIGAICECPTRMELRTNEKTCYVPKGFMLFTLMGAIYKTSTDTYKFPQRLPFSDTSHVVSLDVDYARGRIVWVNKKMGDHGIYSAYFNGSGFNAIRTVDVEHVGMVVIDWMSGNVYWANRNILSPRIEVARLDGSHHKVLIYGEKVFKPGILMINLHARKVYWTQAQADGLQKRQERNTIVKTAPSLWQANLDGSQREEILVGYEPTSCAINYRTNVIFCCVMNRSYSIVSFDPATRRLRTLRENTAHLDGLHVFKDELIYNVVQDNIFRKISLKPNTSSLVPVTLFKHSVNNWVEDVAFYHPDVQTGSNACSFNNGGCQQLCFALPSNQVKCDCETHFQLSSDGKSCTEPTFFMVAKQENSFLRFDYNSDKPEKILSIPNNDGVQSIVFDEVRRYIYWLLPHKKQVIGVTMDGKVKATITLVPGNPMLTQELPHDFAIDPHSNSLFWTDEKMNTINFLHLESGSNGTIFQPTTGDSFPRNIVVYSEESLLFWTSKDVENRQSTICSSLFTGTSYNRLLSFGKKSEIRDITIDYPARRLYYLDSGLNVIGSITFQGLTKQEIRLDAGVIPISIAVHGQHVLWATASYIYIVNKTAHVDRQKQFHAKYDELSKIVSVNLTRSKEKNPCSVNNGGCSHICSVNYAVSLEARDNARSHATCGCPIHQELTGSKNCTLTEPCQQRTELFCKADSKCIPLALQCDGKRDCSNGEDEHEIHCVHVYLKPPCKIADGHRQCGAELMCMHTNDWCDGKNDCPHGEDEDKTVCEQCKPGNFRCGGQSDTIICFDNSNRCDGNIDCQDGSDEKDCPKTSGPPTTLPKPTQDASSSHLVAGAVSGAIVFILCVVVAVVLYLKFRNPKNNPSNEDTAVNSIWTLAQLRSSMSMSEDHGKSSVSTYISNDLPFYDRTLNPPPSPITERRRVSTITEHHNHFQYPETQCDHCNRSIIGEEVYHHEEGGRDAPPPTEVSSLMHEVDMYYPLTNQSPSWVVPKTICEDCNSRISSNNSHMNSRIVHNSIPGHSDMHGYPPHNEHMSNGCMYNDVGDVNLDTHYGEERLFMNSDIVVGHHHFDPPPSPCTFYGDHRPPSPTNTEQSSSTMGFRVLRGGRDNQFAPPPSPTSQLL